MTQSPSTVRTDHAMLVVWGQFAHCMGLVQAIKQIPLSQKTVEHRPQGKVLEFLVAILGGLEYLKDLSLSARPLDKDRAVAQAWGQAAWADHSGVSRTLTRLTEAEVAQLAAVLERLSQPFVDQEVAGVLAQGPLVLDGDLSPRPVSNGSQTYPEAEYGRLHDRLQLGYQAAIVSLSSPTYGRIGLSARQHSGKTVSATQAEELVLAAERRLGRRPRRRTDLLAERLQQWRLQGPALTEKVTRAEQSLAQAQLAQAEVRDQLDQAQQKRGALVASYAAKQRPERPHSYLAKARQRVAMFQERLARRIQAVDQAQRWLTRQRDHYRAWQNHTAVLEARLQRLQAENAANPAPIEAIFRLDAGFGTAENLAWIIEMGYEIYSKPYGTWLAGRLSQKRTDTQTWQRVGANAEMKAWPAAAIPDFPYSLDLAAVRFWQGEGYRHSALLHFGPQDVSRNLPGWFHDYNARQLIEAGNKEAKQVFEIRHLKVRSRPALQLQEHFALFAANFVRFATLWLAQQCPQIPDGWKNSAQPQVKNQVKVGAHAPALVEWLGQDCLVRFGDRSVLAGRSFTVRRQLAIQLTLPWKFVDFSLI